MNLSYGWLSYPVTGLFGCRYIHNSSFLDWPMFYNLQQNWNKINYDWAHILYFVGLLRLWSGRLQLFWSQLNNKFVQIWGPLSDIYLLLSRNFPNLDFPFICKWSLIWGPLSYQICILKSWGRFPSFLFVWREVVIGWKFFSFLEYDVVWLLTQNWCCWFHFLVRLANCCLHHGCWFVCCFGFSVSTKLSFIKLSCL